MRCIQDLSTLFYVFLKITYGVWKLSKLPTPIVSIFGGVSVKDTDFYFKKADELSQRLIQHNISVITGGGVGIMQAASCGILHFSSVKHTAKIIGIGLKNLYEKPNICVQEYFEVGELFARKWLLTHYATAFVVFPGGFGTLDELAETLTLMQTKQLKTIPIVLFGKEYWSPFLNWAQNELLDHSLIKAQDLDLFHITDDLDELFSLICEHCKRPEHSA